MLTKLLCNLRAIGRTATAGQSMHVARQHRVSEHQANITMKQIGLALTLLVAFALVSCRQSATKGACKTGQTINHRVGSSDHFEMID